MMIPFVTIKVEWLELLEALIQVVITAGAMTLPSRRLRFWLYQALSAHLMILGWAVCLWPALARATRFYWNDDNPPTGSWWQKYVWLAWRNPVANLRHLTWAQEKGPLTYRTWTLLGKEFYYKAGWMSDGYCAFSAGAGRGY